MDLIGIQIVSTTFGIFMMYFSYLCYKRGYFEVYTLIIWLVVFILVIIATLFPTIFLPFAKILKIARLFDLFMVVGIFFLILITFLNFIHMQKIKIKMEKLVQDKAIKESEIKKEN